MTAYYNEHDPYAAAWLRRLIERDLIVPGDVDERDVREVNAADLAGYEQVHLFAGIGGWSYALRLADWPDDRPVWTASCPCQPFSDAGRRKGTTDDRHLWPTLFELVRECRPVVLFGEQVASKAGLAWFDVVSTDLEGADYAVGAADLCAAGIGAPHLRQRLWFVADYQCKGLEIDSRIGGDTAAERATFERGSKTGGLEQPDRERCEGQRLHVRERRPEQGVSETAGEGKGCELVYSASERETGTEQQGRLGESLGASEGCFWHPSDWVLCRDPSRARWRPVEPGTFPLADGVPARVGRLRAYGNAIVAPLAAEFIAAYIEARGASCG